MGEPETVIRVSELSKRYVISRNAEKLPYRTLRDTLTSGAANLGRRLLGRQPAADPGREEFWALKDVSFEVKRGEVVGIIGRNGAGKSTLLKILSRITEPTAGEVELNGRVASLLEVGTGFHPELTGRENIYLNGSILGMSRAEVRRKFDEIVAFAEVEKFLDTPVKRYSSGMYVRLAFAVAAHLEPEILIVDEVLAVGDAAFQKKCFNKIRGITDGGCTVLLVSHQLVLVQALCDMAIYLDTGHVRTHDTVAAVVTQYLSATQQSASGIGAISRDHPRRGNGKVIITSCHLEDTAGNRLTDAVCGMDLAIVMEYQSNYVSKSDVLDVGVSIHDAEDRTVFVLYSSYTGCRLSPSHRGGRLNCLIPRFPVVPGKYRLGVRVLVNDVESDWPEGGVGDFRVEPGDFYRTGNYGCDGAVSFLVDGRWEGVHAH